jgi:DNA-binding transcriptional LysR family regulator
LTAAGSVVLDFARDVLARVAAMDDELDRLRRGVSGRLVVGAFQSVSSEILPAVIGRMRAEASDVDVELVETDELHVLIDGVLDDQLDLAFTVDLEPDERFEVEVLGDDPFVVIAPAGQTSGPHVTATDLNAHPLVGQPYDDTAQQMIDRRLVGVGVRTEYAFRFRDNGAVQSMVRNGLGWSVMPALAINANDPGIDVVELDPPIDPRTVQLVRRSGRTLPVAAERFTRISAEVAAPLLRPASPMGAAPPG